MLFRTINKRNSRLICLYIDRQKEYMIAREILHNMKHPVCACVNERVGVFCFFSKTARNITSSCLELFFIRTL